MNKSENSNTDKVLQKDPLKELRAWQRYHIRLTGLYGGAILLVLTMLGFNFYQSAVNSEVQNLQEKLLTTVTSLSASLDVNAIEVVALENDTVTDLHRKIYRLFEQVAGKDQDMETIYILRATAEPTKLRFFVDYAKDGNTGKPGDLYDATDVPIMLKGFTHPAVENEPYEDEFGVTLSGYAPIFNKDHRSIGIVGVDVNASRLKTIKREAVVNVVNAFGLAMILLGIVAISVARNVRNPLTQIIDAAAAISRGELKTRIVMQRNDELGVMGRHINLMAEQLQEREFIRETFGRYVSEEVAKTLLTQHDTAQTLGGEERVVTVLFCDMRGYSTLSEQMPPQQVVDMLNRYLSALTDIIYEHNGCVIEFMGDAIFAVFGAPHYIPNHAEKAVLCAIDMRTRLVSLNRELQEAGITRYWKSHEISGLSARIGIHTGDVVAGNLGSRTRMKYAVIGDTVNVAARLEVLNKELGTDILLSRDVYTQLPDDLTSQLVSHGEHKVKGREQSVTVYSVGKPRPNLTVLPGQSSQANQSEQSG